MKHHSEVTPGVGETPAEHPIRTEFLDYVAKSGLRAACLAASELRMVAGARPTEFPVAAERAQALQQIIAYMELGLKEAGYDDAGINRVPKSDVRIIPRDPTKPRTNL